MIITSFRDETKAFCREIEFERQQGATVVSVICRDGAAWQTRMAITTVRQDGQSHAPASARVTWSVSLA